MGLLLDLPFYLHKQVVEKAAFDVDELTAALDLIGQFECALKRGECGSSPEACSSWLTRIRRECADLFELPALLAAVARPLLDSMLISWKPLVVSFLMRLSPLTIRISIRQLGVSNFRFFE